MSEKYRKNNRILLVIFCAIVLCLIFIFVVNYLEQNGDYGIFELIGDEKIELYIGDTFVDDGVIARINENVDISDNVVVDGNVDTSKPGTYYITYKVIINNKTKELKRTYVVVNKAKAYIELFGEKEITLKIGEPYVEPGYKGYEKGIEVQNVVVTNEIKLNEVGKYKVTYHFISSDGEKISDYRFVTVRPVNNLNFELFGSENIKVFLNSKYVESGYKVIDYIDGDITKKVVVSGTVNTSKPGIYVITYSVVNSSGEKMVLTRNVEVLEQAVGAITLKMNGSNNIIIYKGEDFVDPFVVAQDTNDGDITSKVVVNGRVDVNKIGKYSIKYSISNTTGVTSNLVRTVTVIDKLKMTYSYSSTEFINTSVKIVGTITSGEVDYVLLPDGSKKSSTNIEYSISKNGIYRFIAYDIKNKTYEQIVKISNIDNVSPTAVCDAIIDGKKINVTVSSVSEEKCTFQYVTDNVTSEYSNSLTFVSDSSKNIHVNIKDKAGNISDINCTIQSKNVEYISEQGYNCIKPYTCFKQQDFNDSKYKFCSTDTCGTIKNRGCSITSVATIISGFNKKASNGLVYTPYTLLDEVYDKVCSKYCSGTTASSRAFKYVGLNIVGSNSYVFNNENASILLNHLKNGFPALIRVRKGWYTTGGHIMALLSFKEPNFVFLYDPGTKIGTVNSFGHAVNTFVPLQDIINQCGSSCWFQLVKN